MFHVFKNQTNNEMLITWVSTWCDVVFKHKVRKESHKVHGVFFCNKVLKKCDILFNRKARKENHKVHGVGLLHTEEKSLSAL